MLAKESRNIFLNYVEQSVVSRRDRSRGNLDVIEFAHIVTGNPMSFGEDRKHKNYDCSVRSNLVGPVALPEREALWTITYKEKKDLYGTAGIIAVGGKDGDNEDGADGANRSRQPPRNNQTQEPASYGALTTAFYDDLIDWFKVRAANGVCA